MPVSVPRGISLLISDLFRFRPVDPPGPITFLPSFLRSFLVPFMLGRHNTEKCLRLAGSTAKSHGRLWANALPRSRSLLSSHSQQSFARIQLRHLRHMTTPELRKEFTEYFVKEHGHVSVKSSSLIPHNDKSLMFTNAGKSSVLF